MGVFQCEEFNKYENSSDRPFQMPKIQNGCPQTGSTYILTTRRDISKIPKAR